MLISPQHQEIIKLRERNEWLEAELARLTDAHAARTGRIMTRLKVSKTQANILSSLATGKIMTRECIADMCGASEEWQLRNVDSHVKKMRQKIRAKGLDVTALYGVGYVCEGDQLTRLRAMIGDC